MPVHVRPATRADRDFAVSLVPRLRAFGPVPLRDDASHDRSEREALEEALDRAPTRDEVVLIAELTGAPAGVAYAHAATDYFTRETHGHLSILAVSAGGEGRGVGRALLAAVEEWARGRGWRLLTLNVFDGNARARAVYERAGFAPDTIKYTKALAPAAEHGDTGGAAGP